MKGRKAQLAPRMSQCIHKECPGWGAELMLQSRYQECRRTCSRGTGSMREECGDHEELITGHSFSQEGRLREPSSQLSWRLTVVSRWGEQAMVAGLTSVRRASSLTRVQLESAGSSSRAWTYKCYPKGQSSLRNDGVPGLVVMLATEASVPSSASQPHFCPSPFRPDLPLCEEG